MEEPAGEQPLQPLWKRWADRFLLHPTDPTTTLIWAGITGVVAGCVAVVFHAFFLLLTRLCIRLVAGASSQASSLLEAADDIPNLERLLLPAAGAAVATVLLMKFRKQLLRGPGEVLEAVAITDGRIPLRPSLLKATASLLAIASGGSIGREGPMIQLGAMTASQIGQKLGFTPSRLRILAGCGVAAGLAVAYHVTIGAALFVMEVIFGNFALELFGPLVLSSVLATLVARFAYGSEPLFGGASFTFHPGEVPLYLFLGVFAGAIAPLFMRTLWRIEKAFKRGIPPLWIRLPLAGLVIGAIGIWKPEIWGNGTDTIHKITHGGMHWHLLILLFLLKPLATACMVGGGAPGGVFTPTLFIGACAGGLLGQVIGGWWPWANGGSAAYSLVGMGAVLAGTTHAPITAIFLLFEMTLNYDAVLPLMLSCSIASVVSRRIHPDSIYTEPLSRQGIRASKIPEAHLLTVTRVRDVARTLLATEVVATTATFPQIVEAFMDSTNKHLYVADGKGRLAGVIALHDIKSVLNTGDQMGFVIAQDLMRPEFPTACSSETLAAVIDRFQRGDCERLPVLAEDSSGMLIGAVSKRDILDLYNREAVQRGSFVATRLAQEPEIADSVLSAYRVETVDLPASWVGRTLAEIDPYREHGVTVLALERYRGLSILQRVPNPFDRLSATDRMIVLGTAEQVRRLKRTR